MQADRRPPALLERTQITKRLRHLQASEPERPTRYREVVLDDAGDLEERAGLRTTLVVLPGRVQEARRPTERHRSLGVPRERPAQQRGRRVCVSIEIGHHRDVTAVWHRAQQGRQRRREVVCAAEQDRVVGVHLDRAVSEHRLALGQWPVARLVEDLAGVVLRLLHVGLVERIDAKHTSGDRRRVLPGEELGSERARDRGAVDVQMLPEGHQVAVGSFAEPGRLDRFDDDGKQPGALLAC